MRTKFDKNEIVIEENLSYIILYNNANQEKARTIIDSKNINKIRDYKWYLRPDGYVATNNYDGKYAYLHNIVIGENILYSDHIDRDRLNNTEGNLRYADGSENGANKGIRKNNISGKVGVHWSKQNNKWCAMIGYNHKHINIGYFDYFEDAVNARIEAEKEYFKEFRPINEMIVNEKY